MLYCMSDLHGCYDKYIKMLEKINFSSDDTLYILGDVSDRREGGIKILRDMMRRENIIPILGNHDYMAYTVLSQLNLEITEETIGGIDETLMQSLLNWQLDGGECTIREFSKLRRDEREELLDYLTEFLIFEEVSVRGSTFLLLHAGLGNFDAARDISSYHLHEIIFERCDYQKKYFEDKILVTGHTPTFYIDEAYRGKIYKKNNHIAIDCGAVYGEALGCICLDTLEEFYV